MLEISAIVKKTEDLFDLFNQHFYAGELTRPAITVSPDSGHGAYGWCSVEEIWKTGDDTHREINLCAEYLDRPMPEVCGTMLHEMAHLYNLQRGIEDVSNNGYYHNKKFKDTAEAHGLVIEKHDKYGWTITTLTAEAAVWLEETLGGEAIHAARLPESGGKEGGRRSKSKNRSIKYVCPECGAIIRATKEVNVICGDCGVAFEREE
jgi:rubrerythrin